MAVPEDIKEKLKNLAQRTGRDMKEILSVYKDKYMDKFVQNDRQFGTDEDKHRYAFQATFVSIASKPPTTTISFIPIGYDERRKTRKGDYISSIYGLTLKDDKVTYQQKKIVCKGEKISSIYQQMTPFKCYEIEVSGGRGPYFAGDYTKFGEPEPEEYDPIDLMVKIWGAKPINIRDTVISPSKLDKNGYVDKLDLRVIRGFVISHNIIDRDDGTQGGVYNIGDESISLSDDDEITDDGILVPNRFTVWCPESLVKWDAESYLDFIGYVQHKSKQGVNGTEPQMNAIMIVPVHGIPIEDDEMED